MIKIIDNFLPIGYYNHLESLILSPEFDWHILDNITNESGDEYSKTGFTHEILMFNESRSKHLDFIKPFLMTIDGMIGGEGPLRCRADMLININQEVLHTPHIDIPSSESNYVTAIFYIGDSDGETVIYNERRKKINASIPDNLTIQRTVEPKANRLVLFAGDTWHTGHSPTQHPKRVLLNSNFQVNKGSIFYE
jgi:hypothetical protein